MKRITIALLFATTTTIAHADPDIVAGGDWAQVTYDGANLECRAAASQLKPANTIITVLGPDGLSLGSVGCEPGKGQTRNAIAIAAYPVKLQAMVMFSADTGVKGFTPVQMVATYSIASAAGWSPSSPHHVVQPFDLWRITVTSDVNFVFNAQRTAQSIAPFAVGQSSDFTFGGSLFVRAGASDGAWLVAPRAGGIAGTAQLIDAKGARTSLPVTFGKAGRYVVKDGAITAQ